MEGDADDEVRPGRTGVRILGDLCRAVMTRELIGW